MEQDETIIYLL